MGDSVVAVLLLLRARAVEAQPAGHAIHTVGVLILHSRQAVGYTAFVDTLRQLGHEPDRICDFSSAQQRGKLDRLLRCNRTRWKRGSTPSWPSTPRTRAAMQATTQIPIVMSIVGDPIGAGFVSNLARPGGNVTGISNIQAELGAKRLQLLTEAVPAAKRIAVLLNPADPVTVPRYRTPNAPCPSSVSRSAFSLREPGELPATFTAMRAWRADAALWLAGQALTFHLETIELAAQHRLPVMVAPGADVEAGGLIAYAADHVELSRRTALYVDRILKGTKPGDLPVEQPMKFQLVINLKTAHALGLTIPPGAAVPGRPVLLSSGAPSPETRHVR